MKNFPEIFRTKCPEYDIVHALAICDVVKNRIGNPIRDIENGKIPKENVIKILQLAFENNFIGKNFFIESMNKVSNIGRPMQVTA